MNHLKEISKYIRTGSHAIIGCNQSDIVGSLIATVEADGSGLPTSTVSLGLASSEQEVTQLILNGCANLAEQIGGSIPASVSAIDSCLSVTMKHFRAEARQGILFITEFDRAIRAQKLYTIEGRLRSAMQYADDVAVVVCCSRVASIEIRGTDRPFYRSFRQFRL